MASIQPITSKRHGRRWRVQVYVNNKRDSQIFDTKAKAAAWGLKRGVELSGHNKKAHDGILADLIDVYATDVTPKHDGAHWEKIRLDKFKRDPIAKISLGRLTSDDLAEFRDRRLKEVQGSSVRREMALLATVLEHGRTELKWLPANPIRDVKKPGNARSRRRRISEDEITTMMEATGLAGGLRADTAMQRTGLAFLLGIETAMRSSEMLSLCADTVFLDQRYVDLPKTKNGDARSVPLTSRAVEILQLLPNCSFNLQADTRDTLFRRARGTTTIRNLHFHDSRAEGIWRLSKKFDVLELARVIGHKDIRSLMFYYEATPTELAAKLD